MDDSVWRTVLVIIGALVFLFSYSILALAYWKRDYPPLKSKQLSIVYCSVISGTFWWIGNLQAHSIVRPVGILQYCALWAVLLQYVLGVSLYLTLFTMRILRLYFILVRGCEPKGFLFWGVLISFHSPSVLVGIVSVVFPDRFGALKAEEVAGLGLVCNLPFSVYKYLMFGNTFIQILLILYLNKQIMSIRRAFNEFCENMYAFGALFVILCLNLGLHFGLQTTNIGKVFISLSNLIGANTMLFVVLGPLWGCIRYPREYLAQWKAGLRTEQLPTPLLYGIRSDSVVSVSPSLIEHIKSLESLRTA
jgi:hypothetical protein